MTPAPLLSAKDLLVRFGENTVVDIGSLDIFPAETLAVIGKNGSGKSTLLQCLGGLFRPTAGEVLFHSAPIWKGTSTLSYRRRIAAVFQESLLLDTSVYQNVALGLKLRGVTGQRAAKSVEVNLERFGVSHLAKRSGRNLSGGEAQRVSLARAFAVEPELIFLDEPFAALDPPTREKLLEDLGRTLRETGVAALVVTHDRGEALHLASRLAVMDQGRVLQVGKPMEVMNRPASEAVASFVGMDTLLVGRVIGGEEGVFTVLTEGREICVAGDAQTGMEVVLGVRPENVTLHPANQVEPSSARNRFDGVVGAVVATGPLSRVRINCGFSLTALVTAGSVEKMGLAPGTPVSATIKATAIHLVAKRAA